jgi:hypothetical protein
VPAESRARDGFHAVPLEPLIHPRQRMAGSLPNPSSDDVSCKEELCASGDRHGDKCGRRPGDGTKRDSSRRSEHRQGYANCVQRQEQRDEQRRPSAAGPIHPSAQLGEWIHRSIQEMAPRHRAGDFARSTCASPLSNVRCRHALTRTANTLDPTGQMTGGRLVNQNV